MQDNHYIYFYKLNIDKLSDDMFFSLLFQKIEKSYYGLYDLQNTNILKKQFLYLLLRVRTTKENFLFCLCFSLTYCFR